MDPKGRSSTNGSPTISHAGCSGSVASVSLRFGGRLKWLINLFSDSMGRDLRDELRTEVRRALPQDFVCERQKISRCIGRTENCLRVLALFNGPQLFDPQKPVGIRIKTIDGPLAHQDDFLVFL
ncbi:lipopolysaccharide-binding protein [Elysia marginata]|uniref:Lipopolysaccharide-binding protein n=1 Tax=Elysia marginata TaxID=1093978 RepID=A0AAV4FJT7_9GAST|nr:lipopolysaccharide-binding protein [Elysia marginata]